MGLLCEFSIKNTWIVRLSIIINHWLYFTNAFIIIQCCFYRISLVNTWFKRIISLLRHKLLIWRIKLREHFYLRRRNWKLLLINIIFYVHFPCNIVRTAISKVILNLPFLKIIQKSYLFFYVFLNIIFYSLFLTESHFEPYLSLFS